MKKLEKKKVITLLQKKKYSYKEIALISGYHEKSLTRLNSQIRNSTISTVHGNKNRKPHNYIDSKVKEMLIKKFKTGNYKCYKDFYDQLEKKFSYSFISKLLSSHKLKVKKQKTNVIKRKMIADNTIQYQNIRYKVVKGNIKHLEEVTLNIKGLYIIYKNKKYYILPLKKVTPKAGVTKYY